MKTNILGIPAAVIALSMAAAAQESPYVLERSRLSTVDVTTAWHNCIAAVRSAPVVVNTVDPMSRLIAFTMPLGLDGVKHLVLDSTDIDKQPLTLHVVVWISQIDNRTRLYVRASPNGGGFFGHSNGQIERQLLDAIEKGSPWIAAKDNSDQGQIINATPEHTQQAAADLLTKAQRITLNAKSADPALVTFSLFIPSADLKNYVANLKNAFHPGVVNMTLWFEPSGSATEVRSSTLIFESGSLSFAPLPSNGQLEAKILAAIQDRLKGQTDSVIGIGSDYLGKAQFWNTLFALGTNAKGPAPLTRDLPVPFERAWTASLQVITQSQVIVAVDHAAHSLEFVVAHTSEIGTKYSVHRVLLAFSPIGEGTRMSLAVSGAHETVTEAENDLKAFAERIGMELFLKDRLNWLKKGTK
jgi:hypothetical protein